MPQSIRPTRRAALAVLAAAAATAPGRASGQAWPQRPVQVVVPFAAGGPTDVQARLVCEELSRRLGQQFVIENRAGAGGNVGAAAVARSAADGYTLLAGTVGTHAINQFLYARLDFDPERDFAPVAMIATGPNVFVVNAAAPFRTVADVVAAAKARPGGLSYASPGSGTSNHLAMELFKARAGVAIEGVSYRGAGPALADVMAGHVPMMFNGIDNVLPSVRGGQVRAIALSSAERSPLLPDVPTLVEAGYRDFLTASWTMMFAPKATPEPVVRRLSGLVGEITSSGRVADRFRELGLGAPAMDAPALDAFLAAERRRWAEAVRASGARVE